MVVGSNPRAETAFRHYSSDGRWRSFGMMRAFRRPRASCNDPLRDGSGGVGLAGWVRSPEQRLGLGIIDDARDLRERGKRASEPPGRVDLRDEVDVGQAWPGAEAVGVAVLDQGFDGAEALADPVTDPAMLVTRTISTVGSSAGSA